MFVIVDVCNGVPSNGALVDYLQNTFSLSVLPMRLRDAAKMIPKCVAVFVTCETSDWKTTMDREGVEWLFHCIARDGVNAMVIGKAHEAVADMYGGIVVECKHVKGMLGVSLLDKLKDVSTDNMHAQFLFDSNHVVVSSPIDWKPASIRSFSIGLNAITMMSTTTGDSTLISVQFYPELSKAHGRDVLEQFCTSCGVSKKYTACYSNYKNENIVRQIQKYYTPKSVTLNKTTTAIVPFSPNQAHKGTTVFKGGRPVSVIGAERLSSPTALQPVNMARNLYESTNVTTDESGDDWTKEWSTSWEYMNDEKDSDENAHDQDYDASTDDNSQRWYFSDNDDNYTLHSPTYSYPPSPPFKKDCDDEPSFEPGYEGGGLHQGVVVD